MPLKPLATYIVSVPERVLRSTAALTAGLIREVGNVTLPKSLRRTRLYQTMVETTLRFLIEQVGEVEGAYPAEGKLASNFLIQRTVGDGIDFAGVLAFGASPVWVLAALADISGAGRQLMNEITASLKDQGLLDRDTDFQSVDQVLDGMERTAGCLATSIRFPPLDVAGLRREWSAVKEAAATIPPRSRPQPEQVRRQWEDLKQAAESQHRTVFELSSLMAIHALRTVPDKLLWLSKSATVATRSTGQFFATGLLEHYRTTLQEIRQTGYAAYCAQEFRPYLSAAARQFKAEHRSLTERLLDRAHRGQ